MIYLDYSATTPVEEEVLKTYEKVSREYIGNVNSLHQLGVASKALQDQATKQIADLLKVKPQEIIYTSGASESNNLAIKGIALQYQNRGKHILSTPLEHSSILEPLRYLESLGFEIEYLSLKEDGTIDLEELQKKVRDDTILVTIASVSSELGILQPIEEIGAFLKQYPKCFFHVDMTQSIGKVEVPLDLVDLASFSAHKFYGVKGIGALIKKERIELVPLIHGGKSTTKYRSGTPPLPLIVSMAKALRLALEDLEKKEEIVRNHQTRILEHMKMEQEVYLNSTEKSIPHIINISIPSVRPETFLHALEEKEIYLSTQSACAKKDTPSLSVLSVTKEEKRATTSLRISLSSKTTKEEVDTFLKVFDQTLEHLSK